MGKENTQSPRNVTHAVVTTKRRYNMLFCLKSEQQKKQRLYRTQLYHVSAILLNIYVDRNGKQTEKYLLLNKKIRTQAVLPGKRQTSKLLDLIGDYHCL